MLASSTQHLIAEIEELEDVIADYKDEGYRVNEELLARLERLRVELSLEQDK